MPGQTLSEIRQLLAGAGLAPRHRFGQNFLIDLNLMRRLVDAAQVAADDVLLEVGPGTGSLTELLLDRGARVIAVEVDRGLVELLAGRLGGQTRFHLIHGDALSSKHEICSDALCLLGQCCGADRCFKLVSNLPYQIATPLICNVLLLGVPRPALIACTLQREVAARLVALPRTAAYGPLSVIVQTLADVETVAHLPASVFWPRPDVESSMVLIRPKRERFDPAGEFAEFVRGCFGHRRQTLRRILSRVSPWAPEALDRAGIGSTCRPEELTPEAWQRLHRFCSPSP